ncbi:unnamed protein product [Dicrocoelium dendriticum]|nr:unnamed protein product [Dicrocoelium dendriticum]
MSADSSHYIIFYLQLYVMNPYSFKRFLEHPERPRHPVQLVCTDANSILVHGELPDCVQNPNTHATPPVVPDLNRTTSQSLSPHGTIPPSISFPCNSRSMPEVSTSSYSDYTSNPPTLRTTFPLNMPLPDIHPSTSCDDNQRAASSHCRESINLDILPQRLPDFITYSNCCRNVTSDAQHRDPIRPPNVFQSKQIPRRSNSFSNLFNGPVHPASSASNSCPRRSYSDLLSHSRSLKQTTVKPLTPLHPALSDVDSTSTLPAAPFPDPQSTNCSSSVPLWLHQQEIATLRTQQSALEDQLNRTRAQLRDRESL